MEVLIFSLLTPMNHLHGLPPYASTGGTTEME